MVLWYKNFYCKVLQIFLDISRASLMAQWVKLSAIQETQETLVWSLGWEDPLEEGMATHSSILSWRNPWTEEPRRLKSMVFKRVRHNLASNTQRHTYIHTHLVGRSCHLWLLLGFFLFFFFFAVLESMKKYKGDSLVFLEWGNRP